MEKDEILKLLHEKGIIDCIVGKYFLTEKYKDLLLQQQTTILDSTAPEKIKNYDNLLDETKNGGEWPAEILESVGRARAVAFMNVCEIPITGKSMGGGTYRIRSIGKAEINILGNIIADTTIDPNTFIECVKLYYKHTTSPKGVKNLIQDGVIFELYNEHISGDLIKSLDDTNEENSSRWQ